MQQSAYATFIESCNLPTQIIPSRFNSQMNPIKKCAKEIRGLCVLCKGDRTTTESPRIRSS